MTDILVLDAIDTALARPEFCRCGEYLSVAVHDDAAWHECPAFARRSRLPARLASLVHELLHERRMIVELPAPRADRIRRGRHVPGPVAG